MERAGVRIAFGIANLFVAVLAYGGIFRGLPSRWLPVDLAGIVVIALMGASGMALLLNRRGAAPLARIASVVVLAIGMVLFAALVLTASWLAGVYGPIGRGGAAIFALVAAMVLPYVIVLPAAELLWLGWRDPAKRAA
jgi:hypothetical protein